MRSISSLRNFPSVAFETVPVSVWLMMALSRPLKQFQCWSDWRWPFLVLLNSSSVGLIDDCDDNDGLAKLHAKPCRRPSWSLWRHGRGLAGAEDISHREFVGWRSALWYSVLLWSLPVLQRCSSPLVASIYSVWSSSWLCLGDWWGWLFCSSGTAARCLSWDVWWLRTGSTVLAILQSARSYCRLLWERWLHPFYLPGPVLLGCCRLQLTSLSSSFACKSWTLTAELQRRIQAMETSSYRKLLRILYKDHVSNEEVRVMIQQAIGPHEDLLTIEKRRRLQWYGHVSRSSNLAKTILRGTVKGGRRQGGQRKRFEDNIRDWPGLEFGKSQRAVKNRKKWRKLVANSCVVSQQPSRLRDW